MRICVILRQKTLARDKFFTNSSQLLPAANINRPRYLKEFTISRGLLYALKALTVTSLSFSTANRRHFCSAPRLHCDVHWYTPFRAFRGTRISHREHRGWDWLPSSRISIILYLGIRYYCLVPIGFYWLQKVLTIKFGVLEITFLPNVCLSKLVGVHLERKRILCI